MAIPDFQTLMLPVLKCTSDGEHHQIREIRDLCAQRFRLTPEEKEEMLPSGRQSRFDNRVHWATTYLRKAGLLESPRRGKVQITDRGREVLRSKPAHIDMKYLEQFPEYIEFKNLRHEKEMEPEPSSETPEEILEKSYATLRAELSQEILDQMKQCSPQFFEKLVVDLLVAMGYGGSRADAGRAVGKTGDDGIDGIIKEDKLGLDIVSIQAKRWENPVGRPYVQAFVGSLAGRRAKKGVFITTSRFTDDAIEYVERIEPKVILIDGMRLADLMIDHGVGVSDESVYVVKKIDLDYFEMA